MRAIESQSRHCRRPWAKACLGVLAATLLAVATPAYASSTVVDVLSRSANFSQLVLALQHSRLIPYVNSLKNCTLFAPTDTAFVNAGLDQLVVQAASGREEARRALRHQILYHIVPDVRWDRTQLLRLDSKVGVRAWSTSTEGGRARQVRVLDSAYRNGTWAGGSGLAVRVDLELPRNLTDDVGTMNIGADELDKVTIRVGGTASVLRPDMLATKGVVHELDAIVRPPKDIASQLLELADASEAQQALWADALDARLSGPGPWTVFVPVNRPFREMHWVERSYLAHTRGRADMDMLLSYHMHPGRIYAGEMTNGERNDSVPTLEGESVVVERNDLGMVAVNGKSLLSSDIVGTNGVLHTVGSLLQPQAFSLNAYKYLIGLNATKFVDGLAAAGIDHFANDTERAYTIFAVADEKPGDDVPAAADIYASDAVDDQERERQLRYHILPGSLADNIASVHADALKLGRTSDAGGTYYHLARTVLSDPETKETPQPVRVQVSVEGEVTQVNGADVTVGPVVIGNHTLYLLRAPLSAPSAVSNFLQEEEEGRTMLHALDVSGELSNVQSRHGITLFVPTSKAFDELGLVYDAMLLPGAEAKLRRLMRASIAVEGLLYSDQLAMGRRQLTTLDGGIIMLERQADRPEDGRPVLTLHGDDTLGAGNASVVAADLPIRNGVAHFVDGVVVPKSLHFTLRDLFHAAGAQTFLQAIDRFGLGGLLDAFSMDALDGGYTFFVPTDAAFAQFNDTLLFADPFRMRRVILGHIVRGRITHNGQSSSAEFNTLLGDRRIRLEQRDQDGQLMVGMSGDSNSDQLGSGRWAKVERTGRLPFGMVYRIDNVLLDGRKSGWSWWKALLVVTGSCGALSAGGFGGYRLWVKRRRAAAGYERIL
ncbi:FAS1 domain-containing protein [Thamnocephalis sphaerospora]|uniref:FAS1 domain-containing protein n=1 Tax=Thamnocephalis sphaerospora TaxID=78915 RepID=A0A4P9XXW4_9FUNG|nr:FAS1 domain-containing protein [Thamnocephalis sphaerospora]|eukprot:RKP10521.1 FAS1 domain-containing protein [Thamnocephalis sphaerospora]